MPDAPNGKSYETCHIYSDAGNRMIKWCNIYQTKEERHDKYAFCRFYHLPVTRARQLRDCHWPVIQRFIQAYTHPPQLPLSETADSR